MNEDGLISTRVLVTGASGFVGRAVTLSLGEGGFTVRALVHRAGYTFGEGNLETFSTDIEKGLDLSKALRGVDVVVHCAARVHVMREAYKDSLEAFRAVNVKGTLDLARQAAACGVRRFIFLSSIKVNGEYAPPEKPFRASDPPQPVDSYALSKAEAEEGLGLLSRETGMEVVIIRPPLVYGPGVKGNLAILLKWADSGMPLPLGAVQNRRSLIYLGNLVSFIEACITAPEVAGKTFLVGDNQDLTTAEIIGLMRKGLHRPRRLLPVPQILLEWLLRLFGKSHWRDRLLGSLCVDTSDAHRLVNWTPPFTVEEGITAMIEEHRSVRLRNLEKYRPG